MIVEKDVENEAKTIFIESNTTQWGEWAFCKIRLDLNALVLPLKNLGTSLGLRETSRK